MHSWCSIDCLGPNLPNDPKPISYLWQALVNSSDVSAEVEAWEEVMSGHPVTSWSWRVEGVAWKRRQAWLPLWRRDVLASVWTEEQLDGQKIDKVTGSYCLVSVGGPHLQTILGGFSCVTWRPHPWCFSLCCDSQCCHFLYKSCLAVLAVYQRRSSQIKSYQVSMSYDPIWHVNASDVRLETAGAALALFLPGLPEDRSLLSQEGLVGALDKSSKLFSYKREEGLPFQLIPLIFEFPGSIQLFWGSIPHSSHYTGSSYFATTLYNIVIYYIK